MLVCQKIDNRFIRLLNHLSHKKSLIDLSAFRIHISQQIKEVLDEIGGYHIEYRGPIEFEGGVKTTSHWLTNCDGFHKPLPEPPPLIE